MCEASLHVYRRSGAVAHEANFWAATRADVSNIQAANVPNVVMDQGMADVADFCSRQCAADRTAYVEAQGAAPRGASGAATRGKGGAANMPPPTREAAPSAPIDARPITAENATGRPVLVASVLWPQYACKEFGGAGWAATVLRCSKHTAIVRFTIATTRDGRPYEDARVPLIQLRPVPSRRLTA